MTAADITVRAAVLSDIPFVYGMMRRYIDCPWTAEQIRAELDNESAVFFVAEHGGMPIAFLSGVCAADECEISDIAVEKEFRRRGVATRLFGALTDAVKARGAKTMFLLVRADNAAAKALYASVGFVAVGRRPGYYGGAEAVIMRREL